MRQVLGQRGAARTYLADDTDGPIVLKELSFSTEPSAATLQAFHQEARQLQSLTHPRIPRYLDMLQLGLGADTRLYLAQEFIEGTPLETELASRHSTEQEARELARQVLDILRYLQSRSPQVFHGDLKPANLIRRPDGALFLVDFGAAWVRGRASPESSRHTPPEQTSGELDATTDLFALGVTLVDALSWEPASKLRKSTQVELISRVDVGMGFQKFLARLTSVDPALRFTTADAALRDLDALELPARPPRRSVWPVALGAGAGVLLFGAGFFTGRVTQPAPATRVSRVPAPPAPGLGDVHPPPLPGRTPIVSPRPPTPSTPHRRGGSDISMGDPSQVTEEWAPSHQPVACDYALNGTASASAHWETGVPEAAFDHSSATIWRSAQSSGAWLQVDLGRNQLIDALVADWAWDTAFGASAQSSVMTSLDGSRWNYLHSMINFPQNNNVPRRVWFPQRVARYVRFMGTAWNGGWAHVRSLELYGPDCPLEWDSKAGHGRDASNIEF